MDPHLAVLIGVSSAEFVDLIEVIRRYDNRAELSKITQIIIQTRKAVIMHCGLTPYTPIYISK